MKKFEDAAGYEVQETVKWAGGTQAEVEAITSAETVELGQKAAEAFEATAVIDGAYERTEGVAQLIAELQAEQRTQEGVE